ncbi:hypothetical protein KDA14_02120, partial [Candidatus Saccharibacteria bacterium]|nr:hypothetical protein [Candidatus Saccharibacteria bacterium]
MTKKKTVLIVGLVVLVGLAWFTVRQIQVHNQRKNFYDTQAWLQKVMDEVAKENPGGTRIGESVCLRTSVKYQQGERYCVVGEDILYATSIVEANLAAPKVLTSVKKETEVSIKQLSTKY